MQPSPNEHLLTGLNLLRLLVNNRTAEFHVELELIPQEVRKGSVHIALLHFSRFRRCHAPSR